jgi:hypothetical protein
MVLASVPGLASRLPPVPTIVVVVFAPPVPPAPVAPAAPPVPLDPPVPGMPPVPVAPQLVGPGSASAVPSMQLDAPDPRGLLTTMVAPVALIDCSVMVGPPAGSAKLCPAAVSPV